MKPRSMTLMMLLRRGAFAVACRLPSSLCLAPPLRRNSRRPQPRLPPAAQAPGRGRGPQPVDPRVQIRMHHFAETNEDIPYALFVSSKVRKNKKAPLIVTLHGIGGTHTTMMRPNAIDLAEAGGYILLAPMGYNPRGWYGAPAPQGRRGAPPAPNRAPTDAAAIPAPNGAPQPGAAERGCGTAAGATWSASAGSAEQPERSAEPARAE